MVKLSHLCIRKELEVETGIQVFIILGKTECLKNCLVVLKSFNVLLPHFKIVLYFDQNR